MIVGGVDVGSTETKAVLMDENRRVLGRGQISTGANVVRAAEQAFASALGQAGLSEHEAGWVVGTGYGRYRVLFGDEQVTEIGCHARAAAWAFPGTRTILDIGGQDTKAIRVTAQGEVVEFSMNDKCAAGTGRFLAAAAEVMGLTLDQIGPASLKADKPIRITNVCTVFVESEIMSHLSRGRRMEEILAGVHAAIAGRSAGLLCRVGVEPELTFTGGVSRNAGMVKAIEEKLGIQVNVSPDSQFMGAIGASLYAMDRLASGARRGAPAGGRA